MPYTFDFSFFTKYIGYYVKGAQVTLFYSSFTVIFGTLLGIILATMRISKLSIGAFVRAHNKFEKVLFSFRPFSFLAGIYIEVIRGTPLYTQVLIMVIALPLMGVQIPDPAVPFPLIGASMTRFAACVIALSMNSGAYVSEIVRSGIQAVDPGQSEAARSLGMNGFQTMIHIILPQAIRNILPALGNEFIVIIKESSIISLVGVAELMYNAEIVRNNTFRGLEPMLVAAGFYFVMTFILSKVLGVVERRLARSDR